MRDYWSQENVIVTGAGIASSVKLIKDKLIFGALDNFVYSLKTNGEIDWKFKTEGPVYSTPAIWKNIIYAGSCDGFLYAIDLNGNLLWRFNAEGRIMNSSVVCDNDRILFGTDNGVLFSLNHDGKLLWKFSAGDAIRTTPAIINDKIIFGSHDHNLYCVNENGKNEWKFLAGGNMWTCPCITDKEGNLLWSLSNQVHNTSNEFVIYFGCFDGGLYCVDESGNFIWKFHTNGPVASGPEFDNGILYFGSSDGNLYAVNQESKLQWKFGTKERIGHSSPLITKENIFISSFKTDESSKNGNLHCINKKGESLWKFSTNDAIVSTPVIQGDTLFFGSYDGFLYAISLKKKELLWKFRTLFEKINFDSSKAIKHMESEEERSRNILTTWSPETTPKEEIKSEYKKQTSGYTRNVTLYGSKKGAENFSYSGENYTQKKKRKDIYE
ncbi:MAG TPA: PQQ-binding-like beta-propeller repeat protein [archaeon]|nr:PQQ-binding-like beta-propeller repeat protein [archaeon]